MDEKDLKEIVDDFSFLIEERDTAKLSNILVDMYPADIADVLRHLGEEQREYLFSLIDSKVASDVVVELDDSAREELLEDLDEERISELVDEMDSDDATDVVSELDNAMAERILEHIDEQDSREVKELLLHDEDTAGGIMALEYVSVNQKSTVDEAISEIRRKSEEVSQVYNVYVVDDHGMLVGVLPLKKLIVSSNRTKIQQLMISEVISVHTEMDQEEVANIVRRYNLISVPVVDSSGRLVGRITVDDVVDVVHEEAKEDIQRMAGITDEEQYGETSALKISKVRLPWLITGLCGGLLTAWVMSQFETSLKEIITLAFFVPVIPAMAGNTGVQSSAIIVRGLATGEISLLEARWRLLKEARVALFNGLVCSAIMLLAVTLWHHDLKLGFLLALVLFLAINIAAIVGAIVPIVLKRLKLDPAVAMGPFVTTSNDLIGILVYLGLASLAIHLNLL